MKIKFPLYKKINPIWWVMNEDDKVPIFWYMPNYPMWIRQIFWAFRNPFHNFTFYVMGVADREITSYGIESGRVFKEGGGWKWHIIKVNNWVRLPFISYIGVCKFYIGWRERGNFGFKLTARRQDEKI